MREQSPTYRIMDLEQTERPRERLQHLGAESLSKAELLAILLRTGVPGENAVQVGERLLKEFGGLSGLHRANFQDVCDQHGIGEAKACQIKAALELGHRYKDISLVEKPSITSPQDGADLVRYEMSALEQEELWVILLDVRNRVLDIDKIYRGSLTSSQVRVGEIFKSAIKRNAAAIIVVHNHPSGDPAPSPEDIALTRAIIEAGELLDINVLDHLVIGMGNHVSLKERGLGFK